MVTPESKAAPPDTPAPVTSVEPRQERLEPTQAPIARTDTAALSASPTPDSVENAGLGRSEGGRTETDEPAIIQNPAPPYPRVAQARGMHGTVWLEVVLDDTGRPVRVSVASSSGHRLLDRSARQTVLRRWRFAQAEPPGTHARTARTARVKVVFALDAG